MKPGTIFFELVETLHPGATGKTLVDLLDGKAGRVQALHWYAGRRGVPRWAIDLLAAKVQARASAIERTLEAARSAPERIGLSAGARNLAAWRARQNKTPPD